MASAYIVKHKYRESYLGGWVIPSGTSTVIPTQTTDLTLALRYATFALASAALATFPAQSVLEFPAEVIGVNNLP